MPEIIPREEPAGYQAGQQIGTYRLVRELGKGGYGQVFEAIDEVLGRRAAIKLLLTEHAGRPDIGRRFVAEARALANLSHPGIVSIFSAGSLADGTFYIAMEFLEGRSLRARLRAGPGGLGAHGPYLCQHIAAALAAAHQQGIIHRDVKPDNVMLVRDPAIPGGERPKVVDFGIAKVREEILGSLLEQGRTPAAAMMGTPDYMAPELWKDAAGADAKADVYALGVILYECLCGRRPFLGPSIAEFANQHCNQAPPPIRGLDGAVPEELAALAHAMLAKAPEKRPAMAAVAEQLGRMMVTPTLPEQPGRGRGHRRWLIGAAIGAGAGVAAIAAVLFSGHPPQPVAPDLATAHRGVMPAPDLAPAIVVPPEMVALPGGTLHQGRAPYGKAPAADAPVHDVAIRPFAIDKTEVTVAAYQRFVDAGQAAPPWPTTLQDVSPLARLPVINVAQGDAARYCRWRTPGGRLPTESEWEWAARGPEGWLYPWGDEFKAACVNGLRGAAGFLSPPGSHPCGNTPTGLADMSGNAWEWTSSPASVYPGSALRAPGPGLYVVRGGSFYSKDRDELTATARQFVRAPNRFIGFRCAMDLPR